MSQALRIIKKNITSLKNVRLISFNNNLFIKMSCTLDAREILTYLNELGYRNITAHQLKEFMVDLKKLIKYEEREFQAVHQLNQPNINIFEELYNAGTIASNAKSNRNKESIVTVQISKPKRPTSSTVTKKPSHEDVSVQVSGTRSLPTTTNTTLVPPLIMSAPTTARSTQTKRPKSSFIRPRLNTRPPKSDPVALYHQYQEEWKKLKIPGQSNHNELRWRIREKLLGDQHDYCF